MSSFVSVLETFEVTHIYQTTCYVLAAYWLKQLT